jgi:hypothetical protein
MEEEKGERKRKKIKGKENGSMERLGKQGISGK